MSAVNNRQSGLSAVLQKESKSEGAGLLDREVLALLGELQIDEAHQAKYLAELELMIGIALEQYFESIRNSGL